MTQTQTQNRAKSPVALIVDDDEYMRELIGAALMEDGYQVKHAVDSDTGLRLVDESVPDVVLLDVGLGPNSLGGFEVCRRIRQHSDVPVIFLSVEYSDIDRLSGLAAGADEYLAKPIAPHLLTEYVRAVLRRGHNEAFWESAPIISEQGITIDQDSRTVTVNGTPIELTRTQYELLLALAEHPRRVLTREQLLERVWGDWYGSDHHLDVHISRLRLAIEAAGGPRIPYAVRGVGFRFAE